MLEVATDCSCISQWFSELRYFRLMFFPDPHKDMRHVLITRAVVEGKVPPLTWPHGEGAAAWNAFAEEERLSGEELP